MNNNTSIVYLWDFTQRAFFERLNQERAREMFNEALEYIKKNPFENRNNFLILLKVLQLNCESKRQEKILRDIIDMYNKPLHLMIEDNKRKINQGKVNSVGKIVKMIKNKSI